jgi:hypothetical protein
MRFARVNLFTSLFKIFRCAGKLANMALEASTDMVAPAIDMNRAPLAHAAVLAFVW